MRGSNAKRILIERLSEHYQTQPIRGLHIVGLNSKAVLYLRECKNLGANERLLGKFWFGITESEYSKFLHTNLFIICACVFDSDNADYLVLPSSEFEKIKNEIALRSGQWKFNIMKSIERRYFLQIPHKVDLDVTEFLNYFDFTPIEFRKTYAPQLPKLISKEPKEERLAVQKPSFPLEEELLATSKDSSNPKNFEVALEKMFKELGFKCRRIGGAGETDILVEEPARFIIDGKSTRMDSKSAINFTRIKRHMNQNKAEFMIIASVAFDAAVARDAELENATLIDVQRLVHLLKAHKDCMLSPLDYAELFRKPGLVTKERFAEIERKIDFQRDIVRRILIIMENLDFSYRSVDEMKGRMDLYCDQKGIEKIDKAEIKALLEILAHRIFGIVDRRESQFASRFAPLKNMEKMRNTLMLLLKHQVEL